MKLIIRTKTSLRVWAALLIALNFSAYIHSQTIPRIRITGKVKEASSNEPLYFVQVYLANTSLGCTTDEKGRFTIEKVPPGNYRLIVSIIGYERQELDIECTQSKDQTCNFKLKPVVLEGEEVTISAPHPREWLKNLKRFETIFIGSSEFAQKCRILNPEVLDFRHDKNSGILAAVSALPLQIENRALGYTISYTLETFAIQENMFLQSSGFTFFKEMVPENDKEAAVWKHNRETAYYGSVRHFMTSLIQDRLKEEGYIIHKASDLPLADRMIQLEEIQPDTLVFPGPTPYEKEFVFPQFMRVVYAYKPEENAYVEQLGSKHKILNQKVDGQVSWLEANQPVLSANLNGNIDNPYALTLYGYWAWDERIANMLPLDYYPGSEWLEIPAMTEETEYALSPEESAALLKQAKKLALEENLAEASRTLNEGLQSLGNHPYADMVFKEIWDILNVDDLKAYKKTNDKGRFLYQIWQKLDPTPATIENERYIEHQKRLEYARRWYSSPQPRGYDDRGMIFVRYGQPDNKVEMPSHAYMYPNESWVYWGFGSEISFDFVQLGGMYRLNNDFSINKISAAEVTTLRQGDISRDQQIIEFLEPRVNLGLKYAKLYIYYNSLRMGQVASPYTIDDYRTETNIEHAKLPRSAIRWTKPEAPLDCTIALARFFRQTKARLEIYYCVPWKELHAERTESGGYKSNLNIHTIIRDNAANIIVRDAKAKEIILGSKESLADQLYISQINHALPPGKYFVSLEITNPEANKAAEKTFQLEIPELSDRFLISDIQLASDIQPLENRNEISPFIKNNLLIIPHPFAAVSRKKPFYIYFEINNLVFGENGQTAYTVHYEVTAEKTGLQRIIPFSKGKLALSSSYQRTAQNRNETEYFALDVSKVSPGDYTLKIKVTDHMVGMSRTSEINLDIVE
jgi:GWxTD domain-containing protein